MFKNCVFYFMLCAITIIAGIDTFWTVETQEQILQNEKNPISKLLIQNHGVGMFLGIKLVLTTLVVSLLQLQYYRLKKKRWMLWTVTCGLLLFQIVLLLMLMSWPPFGHSWS